MSAMWAVDNIENKHSLYCGEDCMKKLCISLKGHAADALNFEKKKMLLLTENELNSHQDATQSYIWKKDFSQKPEKDKCHQNVRDHCRFNGKYSSVAHSICKVS